MDNNKDWCNTRIRKLNRGKSRENSSHFCHIQIALRPCGAVCIILHAVCTISTRACAIYVAVMRTTMPTFTLIRVASTYLRILPIHQSLLVLIRNKTQGRIRGEHWGDRSQKLKQICNNFKNFGAHAQKIFCLRRVFRGSRIKTLALYFSTLAPSPCKNPCGGPHGHRKKLIQWIQIKSVWKWWLFYPTSMKTYL